MTNINLFKDVHLFDGKWNGSDVPKRSVQEKELLWQWLRSKITPIKYQQNGIMGLELIMKDTQRLSNCDNINKVYADDILAEIIVTIQKNPEIQPDIIKNIIEQMGDMYCLGRCSQGRTSRLFQIYICL